MHFVGHIVFVHSITSIILSGAEREAAGKLLYTGGTKAPEDATLFYHARGHISCLAKKGSHFWLSRAML